MNKIVIDNQTFEYTLIKENRRSLTLSFKEGKMIVKTPKFISSKEIDAFILSHQKKIVSFFNHYEPYYSIKDGYIYLYGKKYGLKHYDLSKNKCVIHGNELYVYGKNLDKTIDKFIREELYHYIKDAINEYIYESFDLKMPDIEVKKYTGRWGSCYYKENRVSFNKTLIHLEPELIDYVIVHELCHFIESNHSKNFYLEIEKRMSDYKQRIKRLKETHI